MECFCDGAIVVHMQLSKFRGGVHAEGVQGLAMLETVDSVKVQPSYKAPPLHLVESLGSVKMQSI